VNLWRMRRLILQRRSGHAWRRIIRMSLVPPSSVRVESGVGARLRVDLDELAVY
jgi:hypothetical protein